MKRRRQILMALAACATLLASAVLAYGGTDALICDDSPSPLKASSYEISVQQGIGKQIKLVFGDLRDRCVPMPVVTTIMYLVDWSKDGPRPVRGEIATLQLPVGGFTLEDQIAADRAQVTVAAATVRTKAGATSGKMVFELVRRDDAWHVITLSLP